MSAADDRTPLDLDALADEVIRVHRLTSPSQPLAAAAMDFARRVGPDRMILAYHEMIAAKIRRRVADSAPQHSPVRPVPRTPWSSPAPGEPDVPGPDAGEELKPGAVLWHTTETGTGTIREPDPVPPPRSAAPPPDVLSGVIRQPGAETAPFPRRDRAPRPRAAAGMPGWRTTAMRRMSPEDTWGALAEVVDVGVGVRKQRKELTEDDLVLVIAVAESDEREHAKRVTEAYQIGVKARRELCALREHDAQTIGDLPDHVLRSLYSRREA